VRRLPLDSRNLVRSRQRRVHSPIFEVFKPTLDENFMPEPFDIRIASTNETPRVLANQSALEVLRAHVVRIRRLR
jgi:hypothetical protein